MSMVEVSELSGAAIDVLLKLYRHGPQDDGDLPSKAGFSELVEHDFAGRDYARDKANFLTDAGAEVAKHFDEWLHVRKSNPIAKGIARLNEVCQKHGIGKVGDSVVDSLIAFIERHCAPVNPEPPQVSIVWYQSPEELHKAYWQPVADAEGMTVEQLLDDSEMFAQDEQGNEIALAPGSDIEGIRIQGCWGFVGTDSNTIHAWAGADTAPATVIHMLAHEIGHVTGVPHPDELQEEFRAEQFGRAAAMAYELYQQRQS